MNRSLLCVRLSERVNNVRLTHFESEGEEPLKARKRGDDVSPPPVPPPPPPPPPLHLAPANGDSIVSIERIGVIDRFRRRATKTVPDVVRRRYVSYHQHQYQDDHA